MAGSDGTDPSAHHDTTEHLRAQSWFGLKRSVKQALSLPPVNAAMRAVLRAAPSLRSGRLPTPSNVREVAGVVGSARFVMMDPARCENAKDLYWGHGRRTKREDVLALETVAQLAGDADAFLDIGAYTGLFTMATCAANSQLKAHAFEI